jgi:predicted ATPase
LYDPGKHRQYAFLYGGHDPGVCCGYHAAEVLWQLGYVDQALQKSRASLKLARELSHPSTLSSALAFAVWFHQFRGDLQAVTACVEENLALATEQGFSPRVAQTDFLRAWVQAKQGDSLGGVKKMSEILHRQSVRGVSGRWITHCAVLLAETLGECGQVSQALDVVTQGIDMTRQSGGRYYDAELHRVKGELILMRHPSDEQEAEASFRRSLEIASAQSAKSLELRAAMSLSRLWQRQKKRDEARQLLGNVYGWFTEGFDTADLKAAMALLEELS